MDQRGHQPMDGMGQPTGSLRPPVGYPPQSTGRAPYVQSPYPSQQPGQPTGYAPVQQPGQPTGYAPVQPPYPPQQGQQPYPPGQPVPPNGFEIGRAHV